MKYYENSYNFLIINYNFIERDPLDIDGHFLHLFVLLKFNFFYFYFIIRKLCQCIDTFIKEKVILNWKERTSIYARKRGECGTPCIYIYLEIRYCKLNVEVYESLCVGG